MYTLLPVKNTAIIMRGLFSLLVVLSVFTGTACDGNSESHPVISIISTTEDGSYKTGDTINITVNFSKELSLDSGTLDVTLDTGDVISILPFSNAVSASGSYVVSSGDSSNDLDAVALAVATGQLTDVNEKVIPIKLPSNTIADSNSIVVDGVAPAVVNVTSSSDNGAYGDASVIAVQVIFNEPVLVTGTPQLILETGTSDAVVDYATGSGTTTLVFNYTVSGAASHQSEDLQYISVDALTLNGGGVTDQLGNDGNLELPVPGSEGSLSLNRDIVIDTVSPKITGITSTLPDAAYTTGQEIPLQIIFDETVYVTGTPQLSLETGTNDAVVDYSSGSGTSTLVFVYTVAGPNNHATEDLACTGTMALSLNGGTIRDFIGNDGELTIMSPGEPGSLSDNKDIVIDSTPVTVQFSMVSSSLSEFATSPGIEVELSAVAVFPVTVDYTITGTVTQTGDYKDVITGSGTLTISPGSDSAVLPFSIVNDTRDEDEETAVIELSNPAGATIAANSTHTCTIADDDDPPTVSFKTTTSQTVDESESLHEIEVILSQASGKTVQVTLNDSGGTATGFGNDYTLTDGSPHVVTFDPGTVSKLVSFTPFQDVTDESTGETVVLSLSATSNATLGVITTHTATIRDDDNVPTLVVRDSLFSEADCSGNVTVEVYMAGSSGLDVTVDYAVAPGTAGSSDYTPVSGSLTWLAGETGVRSFEVPVACDSVSETTETVKLLISNAQNADIVDGEGVLAISDNDPVFSITSAETMDCDPVDGYIDHYKITFSEDVDDSTFDGYQRNSKGLPTLSWKIAGYSNVRLDHGSAFLDGSTDIENDNVIYLKFDQGSNADTGFVPEVTAVASVLKSLSNGSSLYSGTGSVSEDEVAESDGAGPYIRYVTASNGGGTNGSAGTGDTLTVYYSEATNAPDLAGQNPDTFIQADNSHSLGGGDDITSGEWKSTVFDNDTLILTFATDAPTVAAGDEIKAAGSVILDLVGNSSVSTADVFSPPAVAGTFDDGPRGPMITEAVYLDTDDNGYIDHVKVVFDKNVDDSTFPGYLGDDQVNGITTAWKVSGHSSVALDSSDSLDTETNDNILYLKFSESTVYDTGTKPDLTADKGSAGLRDSVDACYVNTDAGSCLDSSEAAVYTADVNEKDGAPPVITQASVKGTGTRSIFVQFSENVWSEEGMPPCDAGGLLNHSDFTYENNNSDGASNVVNLNSDKCAADDAGVELLSDSTYISSDIYLDKLGATGTQIFDGANNAAKNSVLKVVDYAAAPYVMAASSYYNSISGKHYMRVFFSDSVDRDSALNAANYDITEERPSSCDDFSTTPLSITMVTDRVFDLETGKQCGSSDTAETTYRVTVSENVTGAITGMLLGLPNKAVAHGTDSSDTYSPRLMIAVSTGPDKIKLIFSEPMKSGDTVGSAECRESFTDGADCSADIDNSADGTQLKYALSPSLGEVQSVVQTSDPSVFILTHTSYQTGSFYTVTIYNANPDVDIPSDGYGNSVGGLTEFHGNRVIFKGSGSVGYLDSQSGELTVYNMDDPFNENSESILLFSYKDYIFVGPDAGNSGFYRFEPDGRNPLPVYLYAEGTDCPSGTGTFGYGSSPSICGKDLGPNGEKGLASVVSAAVTVNSTDYELLIACPVTDMMIGNYITQDIDTELSWLLDPFTAVGVEQTRSILSVYAFGDSYYLGLASSDSSLSPILVRQQVTDSNNDGELETGSGIDLNIRTVDSIGKQGSNPAVDSSAVVGIEAMIYIPSGAGPSPDNSFYIANNGGVAYSTGAPTGSGDFLTVFNQSNLTAGSGSDITLVLPDGQEGTGRVRPGEKGIPYIINYQGILYMARNLAVGQTAANETVNSGAELWKCSGGCNIAGNWSLVTESINFDYDSQVANGSNNTAISLLTVVDGFLYLGFDNDTDGITLWRASTEISSESDLTQVGNAGLGGGSANRYIFSTALGEKIDNWYLYISTGNETDSAKVYILEN